MKNSKPICGRCKHYYVTWDADKPKGCKAFGFKGATIPSVAIMRETGSQCSLFSLKDHLKKNSSEKEINLNDDKYW